MEVQITQEVVNTVINSLIATRHSLKQQLRLALDKRREDILKHQLAEVEEALKVFEQFE